MRKVLAAAVAAFALTSAATGALMLGSSVPNAMPAVCGLPVAAGGAISADQVTNARAVARAAADLGLDSRAVLIALTVAVGESDLVALDYGDQAGPDSRGIFQQREGWGTYAERMDPYRAAVGFFAGPNKDGHGGLTSIPDWQTLSITAAGHAVQRNADPGHYTAFEGRARQIAAAAGISLPGAPVDAPSSGAGCQLPGERPVVLTDGPCPLDQPGQVSCNTAISWGMGQIDTTPGLWHNWCLRFVSTAYGGAFVGRPTAYDAAVELASTGQLHADTTQIPRGALLWWDGRAVGNPAGHVAIYLGDGMVLTTDATPDVVGVLPLSTLNSWGQSLMGWSAPSPYTP